MNKKILIIDDEKESLEICKRIIEEKYYVIIADSKEKGLEQLQKNEINCILTDLVLPNVCELEFIEELQKKYPLIPIIVMSGKATVNMAVKAMKSGAFDFVEKPIMNIELLPVLIEKAIGSSELQQENIQLKKQLSINLKRKNLIGKSKKISVILELIKKVAHLNITVLIEGETGSGKELVARMIHENSPRNKNKFVPINCGAVPDSLLESLLFGHSKGSFTGATSDNKGFFEEANHGTLFLDEIAETSSSFQIKLLRVLQEKKIRKVGDNKDIPIDVRIIAATNRHLEKEVAENNFREDLYYRLNVVRILVPPLRERKDDIPLLAIYFLNNFIRNNNLPEHSFSHKTIELLQKEYWQGNVRELQNVVEHAAVMSSERIITPEDLPDYIVRKSDDLGISSDKYLEAKMSFEKKYFKSLLEKCDGNISNAAKISKLTRQRIYQKIKELNIKY
jgi:DNA-binding NtrC family response regulator